MEMSAASRQDEVLDEGFFNTHCKDIEVTAKIDKLMIVDFVKNSQLFSKIQIIFELTETQKIQLYGLYQQATKGDFDEKAFKGLLSIFYSGPSNLEKNAWKAHLGTPREVAMFQWVYEVKKIIDTVPSAD